MTNRSKKEYLLFVFLFLSFSLFSQQFKVATINCEWLSCPNNGPSNTALQVNNIATLIANVDADVVALQEVGTSTSYATVDTLVKRLGSGWGGAITPWSASNCDQNQAFIYKTAKVKNVSSSLITDGGTAANWSSGRFPVLYSFQLITDNGAVNISLINIHAKAYGDAGSYARRQKASQDLKLLLDGNSYKNKNIILIGDYNDYLIGTQCGSCNPNVSPYKNFMDDSQNFMGLTQNLRDPHYNSPVIDNVIISNELFSNYVANSATRDDAAASSINNYINTTSDHYPITVLLAFGTVNVDDVKDSPQFFVYSNAGTTELIIENENFDVHSVQIFDIAGRTLLDAQYSNGIDISNLPQGVYILNIKTDKGIFTQKFIKR